MMRALAVVSALAACGAPSRGAPTDAPETDGPVELDAPIPDASVTDAPADAAVPGIGDPIAELANVEPKCANGWCYFLPKPAGVNYNRIFDTGVDNIWLLGGLTALSVVLQWNGTTWVVHQPVPDPGLAPGVDGAPVSIGGNHPNNMWLIYGGTVQHWDGTSWTIKDTFNQSISTAYNSVWVDEDGVPWITTSQGKIRRYINNAWTEISVGCNCSLGTIFGTSKNDLFLSTIGAVIHFDGQSFTFVLDKTLASFQGIERDVWASGAGVLAHWDGVAFTEVPDPIASTNSLVTAAGFLAPDDVWWSGGGGFVHWDGEELSVTPLDEEATWGDNCCPGTNAHRIIGDRYWAVGRRGGIYTKVSPTTLRPHVDLRSVGASMWGTSADDIYFGSILGLTHWNGTTFEDLGVAVGALQGVPGGGLGGTLEMFGLNNRRDESHNQTIHMMVHFDGISWTETELASSPGNSSANALRGIYALGPDEAMLLTTNGLVRYHDGVFEPPITIAAETRGLFGTSPDHLYITATDGELFEWRSSNPTVITQDTTFPTLTTDPSSELMGVHSAGGVTWVTRQNGSEVYRKAGDGPWQTISLAAVHIFGFKFVAVSADEAFIFGNDATSAARWNGTEFVYEAVPMNQISGAYALPDGTVFAVGSEGILIREP